MQDTLPFAAPEWLEGLALSIRSSSTGRGVVQKETSSAGTTVTTKEAGDDARMQLTTDAKKVVIVLVGVPVRGAVAKWQRATTRPLQMFLFQLAASYFSAWPRRRSSPSSHGP